jgi:hypothetical protein
VRGQRFHRIEGPINPFNSMMMMMMMIVYDDDDSFHCIKMKLNFKFRQTRLVGKLYKSLALISEGGSSLRVLARGEPGRLCRR